MKKNLSARFYINFFFAFTLVAVGFTAYIVYTNLQYIVRIQGDIDHDTKVQITVDVLSSDITNAGTDQREYISTGTQSYLTEYVNEAKGVTSAYKTLQEEIENDSNELNTLTQIAPDITARLAVLSQSTAAFATGGYNAAEAIILQATPANYNTIALNGLTSIGDQNSNNLSQSTDLGISVPQLVLYIILFVVALILLFVFIPVVIINVNITRRDRAENLLTNLNDDLNEKTEAIGEQKELLDTLINDLPIGVFVAKAPDGDVQLINKVGIDLLGKGVEPHANKENYSEIYQTYKPDGAIYPNAELPLSIALSTGETALKEDVVVQKKNGEKVELRVRASPVKNSHNKVVMGVAVFEDITKEKEVDKMKSEFISLASHQLRTPLSAIRWFGEMLVNGDSGELNDEQKEFMNNINQSTMHMIDLVGALLNVSRIDSGRMIIDPVPTNIRTLLDGVLDEVRHRIDESGQHVTKRISKNLPDISIDQKLIRQVFINLLANASKYTPYGGNIVITVSKKADNIIIRIADTGYGIPHAQQSSVFNKFFRGENIIKIGTDGNGLGLYLAKSIVESSGGKIWFESEEGKGTTFWVSLPLAGSPAKEGEVTLDM
jgi:signal transduction histidine kinase